MTHNGVPQRGACAVHLEAGDLGGTNGAAGQGTAHDSLLRGPVGRREGAAASVLHKAKGGQRRRAMLWKQAAVLIVDWALALHKARKQASVATGVYM